VFLVINFTINSRFVIQSFIRAHETIRRPAMLVLSVRGASANTEMSRVVMSE